MSALKLGQKANFARITTSEDFDRDEESTSLLEDSKDSGASPGRFRLRTSLIWQTSLTVLCIGFTLFASLLAFHELVVIFIERIEQHAWGSAAAQALFTLVAACLLYGGLVYQFTRYLHLRRRMRHRPVAPEALEALRDAGLPSLTILVPSYKEEPRVVTKTLLSAALQSYDRHRVVLLIDDPPEASSVEDVRQLRETRELPGQLSALLEPQARYFQTQRRMYLSRCTDGGCDLAAEAKRLVALFERAAAWFDQLAKGFDSRDHSDAVFLDKVLFAWRDELRQRACHASDSPEHLSAEDMDHAFRLLAQLFAVEIASFERKRYVNLSHAANKAMNLNSYLGLMGGRWRERRTAEGLWLDRVAQGPAELEISDSDYVITLDADSLLVPDYALRLVHVAQQPANDRLAVVQTPYSAFPGAPGALERIAGATTDIQYNIHQGFTGWNATFWVGANALLRKAALADIATTVLERGHSVSIYIQDRTVIEDTESTVDLIDHGWTLFNYPDRLAYSATPPDFGSLIIQRRRWANGGLIILPKLLRHLLRGPKTAMKAGEALFRIHYLVSIAAVNIGLIIILAVPFSNSLRSGWLPLTALPYFALYTLDLRRAGYRAWDMVRVYSLNLVLIPVNLSGVFKSLQQAWTKEKIPFGRTPKVKDRTAAAPGYIASLYLLVGHWLGQGGLDVASGHWVHGAFAAGNAALLLYGIAVFVGFRNGWHDLVAPFSPKVRSGATPFSQVRGRGRKEAREEQA